MSETTSRLLRQLASDRGSAVLEQVYPPRDERIGNITGNEAAEALRYPGRVIIWQVCDYVKQADQGANGKTTADYLNHRLEISRDGQSFTLAGWGWHTPEKVEEVVSQTEAKFGETGLTIIIERGSIQRNITPAQSQSADGSR